MTTSLQPDRGQAAVALHLVDKVGFDAWLNALPEPTRALLRAAKFAGKPGEVAPFPANGGHHVAVGVTDASTLGLYDLAPAADRLPAGTYRLEGAQLGPAALGWLLAGYRFDRYRKEHEALAERVLLTPNPAAAEAAQAETAATFLVRDLVNTPAEDSTLR